MYPYIETRLYTHFIPTSFPGRPLTLKPPPPSPIRHPLPVMWSPLTMKPLPRLTLLIRLLPHVLWSSLHHQVYVPLSCLPSPPPALPCDLGSRHRSCCRHQKCQTCQKCKRAPVFLQAGRQLTGCQHPVIGSDNIRCLGQLVRSVVDSYLLNRIGPMLNRQELGGQI